jgi:hypothetical protein
VPLGISVACLAKTPSVYVSGLSAAYNSLNSLVLSFLSLSLAENALVTGLIVYRDIQGLTSRVGYPNVLGRDIVPIISILIESGMLTFTAQLVQTLMYRYYVRNGYLIVGGFIVQLYVRGLYSQLLIQYYIYPIMQGISMAIVIVRVEMGLTYDSDNETSTSLIHFTSSIDSDDNLVP